MAIEISLTDLLQSLAIAASLLVAAWQSREQKRYARAAAEISLVAKFDEVNRVFLDQPALWSGMSADYADVAGSPDLQRLEFAVYMVFNTLEVAFAHFHKHQLIGPEEWQGWLKSIDLQIAQRFVRGWWARNHAEYSDAFVATVDARAQRLATIAMPAAHSEPASKDDGNTATG